MGRTGVERSLRFSWESTAAASLSVYRELAGRAGGDVGP
jgi:hypothetical protein